MFTRNCNLTAMLFMFIERKTMLVKVRMELIEN